VQFTRCQACLFQQLTAGGLLGRLTGLDATAWQAPLVRRSGRDSIAVLQEHRARGIDKQHECDFITGHREIMPCPIHAEGT
jgi:hypothetical protein